MEKRYSQVIKDEVVGKIRNGQKVVDVARHHAINEMTVRTWLERDTAEGASLVLEISRLRRENEALLRLAGQLTSESDVQNKISAESIAEPGSKTRLASEPGVTRSSLYYQRKMLVSDEELRRQIELVMGKNPGDGSPRVSIAL